MFHSGPQSSLFQLPDPTRLPLTPRTPNACPRFSALMTSQRKSSKPTAEERRRSPRSFQLPRKPEQARDLRRQVYLSKVRDASDDKRWESRSDQILRQDFLAHRRTWERQQAMSAPEGPPSPEEEPEEFADAAMVDQILSQEEEELQALISSMNETNQEIDDLETGVHERTISDYGSDEEEYDRLFMDIVSHPQQPNGSQTGLHDNALQDMDVSME